jgi:hypothetical protein
MLAISHQAFYAAGAGFGSRIENIDTTTPQVE